MLLVHVKTTVGDAHIYSELAHLKKERNFTIFFMPLGELLNMLTNILT